MFGAINERRGALRELIVNSKHTFEATASEDDALRQTIAIFPTFLDESKATMARLEDFSHNTHPLVVASVSSVARVMSDDIAAVVVQPTNAATAGLFRTEQLELTARELDTDVAERFLEACGVAPAELEAALYDARMISDRFGGVILHVVFGNRLRVEVLPRNVESIEAASRRAAAAR